MRRRFPEVTEAELKELILELEHTVGDWGDRLKLTGCSVAGAWNLYRAIRRAVEQEHLRARGGGRA